MQRPAQQAGVVDAATSARLWLLSGLRDRHAELLAPRLSDAERTRAVQLLMPAARTRSIVTRAALRTVLGVWLGLPPSRVPLTATDRGRPVVDLPGAPHVSVAHTADVALIGLHPVLPIGVDIEAADRAVHDAVMTRACSDAELASLRASDPDDRAMRFLRYWVRKEAVAKADGRGLARSLRSTDVAAVGWAQRPAGDPRVWVQDVEVGPGYLAALATLDRGTAFDLRVLVLPLNDDSAGERPDPLASLVIDVDPGAVVTGDRDPGSVT